MYQHTAFFVAGGEDAPAIRVSLCNEDDAGITTTVVVTFGHSIDMHLNSIDAIERVAAALVEAHAKLTLARDVESDMAAVADALTDEHAHVAVTAQERAQ